MSSLITNTALGLPTDYAGIHGRPMLTDTDAPGARHLAYVVNIDKPREQWRWRTYCGIDVPGGHLCPTTDELAARRVWVRTACSSCMVTYTH